MRRTRAVLLVAVVALTACFARADRLNIPVKSLLGTELPNVNLANTALVDAIEYLRDATGANINVHWRTLEAARISKDTPVNVRLRSVPMRKALRLILDEAGGGTPLTWYLDQGVIEITTREEADSKLITRVYDVGDLVVEVPDFAGPSLSLTASVGNGSEGGTGGTGHGSGLFANGNGQATGKEITPTLQERGDQLVATVISIVRPDIWSQNGGVATIVFQRGKLIVTAPRSVHEAIGGSID